MKRRRDKERGAVAAVTAVALLALLIIGAAAIDIGKAIYVRGNLQMAVDGAMKAAAAAAVTQSANQTAQQVQDATRATVKGYIRANAIAATDGVVTYDLESTKDLVVTYVPPDPDNLNSNDEDSVVVTLNARVPVSFYRLFFPSIDLSISGRVKRPRPAPVELVIAADLSFSMSETFGKTTKLAALQTAAKSLVATLTKSDYAKIGLVPFAWLIRLDSTLGYATDSPLSSNVPWLTFATYVPIKDCIQQIQTNCRNVTGKCTTDGVTFDCTQKVCDTVCTKTQDRPTYFSGCIYNRPRPYLTTIDNPTSPKYFGVISSGACGQAPVITDLVSQGKTIVSGGKSYDAQTWLNAKIDGMRAVNFGGWGTYIPAALIWSWNMLTTESTAGGIDTDFPLNSGYTAAEVQKLGVRKALVLISDGNNNMYYNPVNNAVALISGLPKDQQPDKLKETNADMLTICTGIKGRGILIYVIGLQVKSDTAFLNTLQTCSSDDGEKPVQAYYFSAEDPKELQDAFNKIGAAFSYNSLKE